MSHTYAQNVIHVVFSTKERRKTISLEFQPKMWAYSAGCSILCAVQQRVGILTLPPSLRPTAFPAHLAVLPFFSFSRRSNSLTVPGACPA